MSRIRAKDLPKRVQRLIAPQLAKGKGTPRAEWQGLHWDSKEEEDYGRHLRALEMGGKIQKLTRQARVDLGVGQRYMRIDFHYWDVYLAEWVWDDYKCLGWRKRGWFKDWALKADIWKAGLGPGLLRITTPSRGGYHHEDSRPKPKSEALRRILKNAHATMNPNEFGEIVAGAIAEAEQ